MADFTVLIIDRDTAFAHSARAVLSHEGFQVALATSVQGALEQFKAAPAALVLLSFGLMDMNGADLCRHLRDMAGGHAATIIMIGEENGLAERVAGFQAGADGFLPKPIDFYELVLRLRAIQRRWPQLNNDAASVLQVGALRLDGNNRTLTTPDSTISLSPVEFQLLHYLMRHPGTLIASETLLQKVWHYPPGVGSSDLVRFHVRTLRKKIEPQPAKPIYLVSAHGHGYMINASAAAPEKIC